MQSQDHKQENQDDVHVHVFMYERRAYYGFRLSGLLDTADSRFF